MNRFGVVLVCVLLVACSPGDEVPVELVPTTAPAEEDEPEESTLIQDSIETFVTTQPNLILNAPFVPSMSGSVDQLGGVHETIFPGDNARDNADFEGFITFDITGMTEGDVVLEALMSFGTCVTSGFPFSESPFGLGSLSVDVSEYGELDVSDYLGTQGDLFLFDLRDCPTQPIDVTSTLPLYLSADFFQLRLYFSGSNGDFYRDDVTITDPQLMIEYIAGD